MAADLGQRLLMHAEAYAYVKATLDGTTWDRVVEVGGRT